jgi:hypothetical protein
MPKPKTQPMVLRSGTPKRSMTIRRKKSLTNLPLNLIERSRVRSKSKTRKVIGRGRHLQKNPINPDTVNVAGLPKHYKLNIPIRTRKIRRLSSLTPSPVKTPTNTKSNSNSRTPVVKFNEEEAIEALQQIKEEIKNIKKEKRLPGFLKTSIEGAEYLQSKLHSTTSDENVKKFTETIEGVSAQYQKWKKDNKLA